MDISDAPRHRPMAFDKMESLIKEMQDQETGVPVRCQKLFLSYIPAAFMGYDLVEWLMERFNLDETCNGECNVSLAGTWPWAAARRRHPLDPSYSEKPKYFPSHFEAINLANQLCQYGYFFPVNDSKNLSLKDDSSLYRFQSPYYWPWQPPRVAGSGGGGAPTVGPDNVEYAIYLVKRTLRNKQRHGLEEHELEAMANLKKNLAAKWDFITMQAEEQVRLAKDRKKGDKIVSDSQERAYWRVARPPPGMQSALEACPVPVRSRQPRVKKKTIQQIQREIGLLKASLDRTRVKTSVALESLVSYAETYAPYDPWLTPPQPSNPWVSDDTLFWQINGPLVEVASEKRVQRWALSMEELVSDPTGLAEFTSFLRKEYSHENIRFWLAVMDLRRSSIKSIPSKLEDIYKEFLKPGAPCEINIDGATMENVLEGKRTGSRYALDHAADHVYGLLLKKDCYPRFIRSEHFQKLLTDGKNVHQKKAKFFTFGSSGQVKKKPSSTSGGVGLARRRGSDRSLSGSAHELALCIAAVRGATDPPPHSHSQCNLSDMPPREAVDDDSSDVAPWESSSQDTVYGSGSRRSRQDSAADSGSSSSDVSGVAAVAAAAAAAGSGERLRRLPQQSTLDGGLRGAPPPLRRLSAVEPRHLAPLASPPRAPIASVPTPATIPPAPHPTPTISVSSAPDDTSPDEPRSDDPPSVFATPTDPTKTIMRDSPIVEVLVSEPTKPTCESNHSVATSDVEPARRTLSREPSATREVCPAATVVEPGGVGGGTVEARAAPLAECEDLAVDDDQPDKVPSAPLQPAAPPNAVAAPLPAATPSTASETDVTKEIAHKDELSSPPEPNIVKRDNSSTSERSQRNDVCPWEDENACESEAPFVKTYATLGYL